MSCGLFSLCVLLAMGDPSQPAAEPEAKQEKTLTTQEAFAEAQKLLQKNDLAGVVQVLERALPGNAQDVNLLLTLAQFSSRLAAADPQKPDYARHRKAADYMRRALKANPGFAAIPGVRNLAGPMYYNEACGLALDNQADKALQVLSEAIEFGYKDLAQMEADADLKSVRELPSYAEFKTKTEETLRKQAEEARARLVEDVEKLFAENEPFDFDFELTDTDGQPIKLADFAGKVLIVDVWGTWCPPCRMEIPHFVALQKKLEEAGLVIVGLNSERAPSQEQAAQMVQDFRKENGMNYRCALVDSETLSQIPDFRAYPTTMFIDRNGEVRGKVVGYQDYDKLEIIVGKLLDEKLDGPPKKKTRLTFGMPGFVRKTPWPVAEQGGVQAHVWVTAFSPDGRTYLVGGDSGPRGIVRLFDLESGKAIQEFRTDKDVWFANASFLPDGQQLVTAYSNDKNVYLWEVATGKLVREFEGHTANGVLAAVSHDGRRIASSGKDDSLRLWDVTTGRDIWTQDVPGQEISRLAFSPDDRLILTSGGDRVLRVRDLKTGAVVATLAGHAAACAGDFSPDGKQVLSWGDDGQIRLWDLGTAKTLRSFEGRPESVRHAWHLDQGRQILTWGKDLTFRVWDAASGRKLREIAVPEMAPPGWNEAVVSPDGERLLVVNSDGADVRLVDLVSGQQLYRSTKGKLLRARGFSFSPDGRHAVSGSFRNGTFLVELPAAQEQRAEREP
ncbi:MAG TPA: redoxin domain-containing protein [Pirellulales bacterium]|jgi:WD40 repeat protein/peroxiredoxin|nr:redoxin domain-containing protein [Pirellulales bacterium]